MSVLTPRADALAWDRADSPREYYLLLIVRFLQGLFNFMPQDHFRWDPDEEKTQITITGDAPLNRTVVEAHPALVVVPGPVQNLHIAVGNLLAANLVTDVMTYTDLYDGAFAIYAIAQSEAVAMRLAEIVDSQMRAHRPLLERPGGFHKIAHQIFTQNPSPPGSLVQGDPESLVMVQVSVPFLYQWTWRTSPNRQDATYRALDMILQEVQARHFPYKERETIERVTLKVSVLPRYRRRIGGVYALRPSQDQVQDGISVVQQIDLRNRE